MNSLKEKILHTVKHEKISMIPRWKFLLYSGTVLFSLVFLILSLIFVMSLAMFLLSSYGYLEMPLEDFGEMIRTLTAVPVFLFLTMIVLVVLIEFVAKQYTTAFRRPVLVMLLIITLSSLCIGYAVSKTPMHEYMHTYMKKHRFERASSMYDRPRPRTSPDGLDIMRGEITSVVDTGATIKLFNGEEIVVDFEELSTSSVSKRLPVAGDDVVMLGTSTQGRFVVKKIKVLPAKDGTGRPSRSFVK